jgi:hypothetical protein
VIFKLAVMGKGWWYKWDLIQKQGKALEPKDIVKPPSFTYVADSHSYTKPMAEDYPYCDTWIYWLHFRCPGFRDTCSWIEST